MVVFGQLKLNTTLHFHFTATHKLFIIELCSWGDEQSDGSACSPWLERLLIFPALRSDSIILPGHARAASSKAPLFLPRCLVTALCIILRDIMYLSVLWVSAIKRWRWLFRGKKENLLEEVQSKQGSEAADQTTLSMHYCTIRTFNLA